MRVLIVHNEYAKPSGEEHTVRSIADTLHSHSHKVEWLLRSSAEIANSPIEKIRVFFSGIYSPCARKRMLKKLSSDRFDIVQIQNLFPLLSPSILGPIKKRGIPIVMRCPNYRLFCPNGLHLCKGQICERCLGPGRELWCILRNCEESFFKSIGYALRNAIARLTHMIKDNVTVFVVLSEFQKKRFINAGIDEDRIEILPNSAPIPGDGHLPTQNTGDTISFAGRLSPEKGITTFLQGAALLPQCLFAVAGDASRMPELVENAPSNVKFCGFLSGKALDVFYNRTRIFVFPSVCFEGFPNVITKAMVAAKPVVCSRIGGLAEIVEDGVTGLLFEPGNVKNLAEKIRYLWERPELCHKMGLAGRERALREYSPGKHYKRLINVYQKAIALASRGSS